MGKPVEGYRRIPRVGYGGAVKSPAWPKHDVAATMAAGKTIRGSALWGPEETYVMRQALWNRLSNRRHQRMPPTIEECQDYYQLDVSVFYFGLMHLFLSYPMFFWADQYRTTHDYMPWGCPRLDNTRGAGNPTWWID